MNCRQSVTCDGIEYLLLYRPTGRASQGWAWLDGADKADPADVPRLRDAFLAQDVALHAPPASLPEMRRLYEILEAMGADPSLIRKRLGAPKPQRCVHCRRLSIDNYPGPRCKPCHEQFVRTSRLRNAGLHDWSGGRMSNARKS